MTLSPPTQAKHFSNLQGVRLMLVILAMNGLLLLVHALLAIPWGNVVDASCHWDCAWYTSLAENGYMSPSDIINTDNKLQVNWAFFPLYPILSRLVAGALGIKIITSEILVNLLLWSSILFLCCKDLSLRGIKASNIFLCLFFILYPMNIWYYSQYSEALYGSLLMGAIVAIRSHRLYPACILSFFLCLSRPTGLPMVICLGVWLLLSTNRPEDSTIPRRSVVDRLRESALLVCAGGAGLSGYVLYLHHLTGDGFAFMHVERAWGKIWHFFPMHILVALRDKDTALYGIYALYILVLLYFMWRKKWILNAALLSVTAFIAASMGVMAIERHIFSNPLTIEFLACCTLNLCPRHTRNILIGMGAAHILFVILWYMNTQSLL